MKHIMGTRNSRIPYFLMLGLLAGCLDSAVETAVSQDGADGNGSANMPPTISGTPPNTIIFGQGYSFTPSASDPDGDSLSFSILNRPNWAAFSAVDGELSGSPTLGDVGQYSDIRISVSDGQVQTSLSDFSIEVAQSADGTITISLTAPSFNSDGSPLLDLTAYKIYYGESEGNYPNSVRIDNPGISTYVLENLVPRQYFIVATAINSSGLESNYSDFIVRTAN